MVVPEPRERAGLVDEPVQVGLRRVDDITLAALLPRRDTAFTGDALATQITPSCPEVP